MYSIKYQSHSDFVLILLLFRNLHYFASKASPTDMLLCYFEAISDAVLNNRPAITKITNQQKQYNQVIDLSMYCLPSDMSQKQHHEEQHDTVFYKTHWFLDTIKLNDDLK